MAGRRPRASASHTCGDRDAEGVTTALSSSVKDGLAQHREPERLTEWLATNAPETIRTSALQFRRRCVIARARVPNWDKPN